MADKKVYKVKILTDGKRNVIRSLIEEYDIHKMFLTDLHQEENKRKKM